MASLTIKNIPDELLRRLQERAMVDKRSLTKEAIYLLEVALSDSRIDEIGRLKAEGRAQIDAWRQLSGQWESDLPIEQEISAIYDARSTGREVDL